MNYRFTVILLVVLAALGAYVYFSGSGSQETKTAAQDNNLQVLSLDEGSINSIEVDRGQSTVLVTKNADGKWALVKPEQSEGDSSRMQTLILSVAKLMATRVVATNSDDLASYGLDKPVAQATIGVSGGDPVKLLIGSSNPASSGSYVKVSGSDSIYLISSYTVSQLTGLVDNPPKATPTPSPSPSVAPSDTLSPTVPPISGTPSPTP